MTEFATRCVHAGLEPDPTYRSIIPAIHQTSTYVQPAPGEHVGEFGYSRSANPTRAALETALGELEGGLACAFSSGMAAEHAVLTASRARGTWCCRTTCTAGRTGSSTRCSRGSGSSTTWSTRPIWTRCAPSVRDDTALIWVETPTNPSLRVIDLAGVLERKRGALVVVDNTFATPVHQRPLELGADAVVHSTTKYLGGHSDVVGGAAIVRDPALHEKVKFVQNAVGAVPGPFDCFLVHRGLRTLHLRVAAHDANGLAVSGWLQEQAGVADVRWPGFGGMVSFRHPDAVRIASSTRVFSLAESLGGVESLIEVPQAMTHQSVEGSIAAVPADLVRLSCGIEASVDLIDDLAQALEP